MQTKSHLCAIYLSHPAVLEKASPCHKGFLVFLCQRDEICQRRAFFMQNTIFHTPIPPLRKLTLTAMLVAMGTALAVVSKYLFGNLPVRIDLAVCPMLTVAYVLGAWWCGGAYVMVDLLSCLVSVKTEMMVCMGEYVKNTSKLLFSRCTTC